MVSGRTGQGGSPEETPGLAWVVEREGRVRLEAQKECLITVELPFQFGGGTEGQQPRLPGGQQWDLRARGCPKFTFSEVGFTGGSRETGQVEAGPGLGLTDAHDL